MTRKRRISKSGQTPLIRLQRNRQFAQDSRLRLKSRIFDLESQAQRLSCEACRLQSIIQKRQQSENANPLTTSGIALLQDYMHVLENDQVTEEEIEGLLQETIGKMGAAGSLRLGALRQAFQSTVSVMIPEAVLCFMALSAADALNLAESGILSSIGLQAAAVFQQFQRDLEIEGLRDLLEQFKTAMGEVWQQMDIFYSLVRTMKQVLSPRQQVHLAVWICMHYYHLKTEAVLDYGHNSTEVLSS